MSAIKLHTKFTKIVRVIVVSILISSSTKSQVNTILDGFGLNAETYFSPNGNGSMYSGSLSYNKRRSSIEIGPCVQKRTMKFGGGKIAYSYLLNWSGSKRFNFLKESLDENSIDTLSDEADFQLGLQEGCVDNRFQLRLYGYVQYLNNLPLSYNVEKMESRVNRIENQNWRLATLSTFESGVGFEMKVRLANNLYWGNYITATVYYNTKYITNMYHEKCAAVLTFGTNLSIPCFKMWKRV